MISSKQSRREAKALFRSTIVNGAPDDNRVRTVVRQLIEQKPRGYLAMLDHLDRLLRLDLERRTARIESAEPLRPEIQASLRQNLSRQYGPGLQFSFTQNPALLGGVRIRVGSDVYDGTVQGRLAQLEQALSQ